MILTGHDITEIAGMRTSSSIFSNLRRSNLMGKEVKVRYPRVIKGQAVDTIQFMLSYDLEKVIEHFEKLSKMEFNRHRETHKKYLSTVSMVKIRKEEIMQYEYSCSQCEKNVIIEKKMMDYAREEKCEECGTIMQRVYDSIALRTGDGFKQKNG